MSQKGKKKKQEKKRDDLQRKKNRTVILWYSNLLRNETKRVAVMKWIFNCTSYAIWKIFSFILGFLTSFRAICM